MAKKTITVRDITLTVDTEAVTDFELVDALDQVDQGNPLRVATAMRRLVGSDQMPVVMDGLRDKKSGRVDAETAADFFAEVLQELAPKF